MWIVPHLRLLKCSMAELERCDHFLSLGFLQFFYNFGYFSHRQRDSNPRSYNNLTLPYATGLFIFDEGLTARISLNVSKLLLIGRTSFSIEKNKVNKQIKQTHSSLHILAMIIYLKLTCANYFLKHWTFCIL